MTTPQTPLSDARLRYLADHPASATAAPAPFGDAYVLRQSELEAVARELLAAREALAARSVPDGWVAVPRVMTPEMHVIWQRMAADPEVTAARIDSYWAQALAAAPSIASTEHAGTAEGVAVTIAGGLTFGSPVKAPGNPSKGRIAGGDQFSVMPKDGRVFVDYPAGGGAFWNINQLQPWSSYRDELGRAVRNAWVKWAKTQPDPKASWLVPYDSLAEADKEADRQIGEALTLHAALATHPVTVAEGTIDKLSAPILWSEIRAVTGKMGDAIDFTGMEVQSAACQILRNRAALYRASPIQSGPALTLIIDVASTTAQTHRIEGRREWADKIDAAVASLAGRTK